jgi:serine/threonine protein kinase
MSLKTILKSSSLTGRQLQNRYQVLKPLGGGAFAQTYIAQDSSQTGQHLCLIKYYTNIRKQPQIFASYRRLFITETSNLLRLDGHNQIPKLLDCFEQEDGLYVVQELIEGDLLSDLFPSPQKNQNCWTQEEVLDLLRNLLGILLFVHNNGIIHCDLKPSNIIKRKSDGRFVLIDFATSQSMFNQEDIQELNQRFSYKKTFAVSPSGYLPPEQIMGHPVPNSDIYALGILVIQALTGIEPINLQLDLITEQLNWEYGLEGKQYVDQRLISILNKMVNYKSAQRYQTITDVIQDLEPLGSAEGFPIKIFLEDTWPGMSQVEDYGQEQPIPVKIRANQENIDLAFVELAQGLLTEYVGPTSPIRQSVDIEIEFDPEEWDEKEQFADFNVKKYLPIVAGVGISACVFAFGFVAFGLGNLPELFSGSGSRRLLKATEAYQKGNFTEAMSLIQSIADDSEAYQEAQQLAQKWQKEWQQSNQNYQQIQEDFAQENWSNVLKKAKKMPQVPYWNSKINPLVQQAQKQIETKAYQLIKQAFEQAENRQFTKALEYLQQIPPESQIYNQVELKLVEYREKQDIRAHYHLQQAFNRAEKRDFLGAIEFLRQIPNQSSVGEVAQAKITQYSQYQKIKERVARRQALSVVILEQKQKLLSFIQSGQEMRAMETVNPGSTLTEVYG